MCNVPTTSFDDWRSMLLENIVFNYRLRFVRVVRVWMKLQQCVAALPGVVQEILLTHDNLEEIMPHFAFYLQHYHQLTTDEIMYSYDLLSQTHLLFVCMVVMLSSMDQLMESYNYISSLHDMQDAQN